MISSKDIFRKVKLPNRYFLSVRNFAKKVSSSSFESCLLGVTFFTKVSADLRMSLGLLEYFDLLLSVSQPAIACSKLTIETLEQGVKYVQS